MADDPERDLVARPAPHPKPPWELQVGYNVEDIYCAYLELHVHLSRGFPDWSIAKMRNMGGWAADRLRELDVPPELVDRLEEALAALPGQHDYPAEPSDKWHATRRQTADEVEQLLVAGRAAVDDRRKRYYDYGVWLRRIRLCATMVQILTADATIAERYGEIAATYRTELRRCVAALHEEVFATDAQVLRDPDLRWLDRTFEKYTAYLSRWRVGSGDPDAEFWQHLENACHAGGFRPSDLARHEQMWLEHPQPVPEPDRLPLPVPHSAEERELLAELLAALNRITVERGEMRLDQRRDLLDTCRHVLGPVHPVTLHTHVSVAMAYANEGKTGRAVVVLMDVANTAVHYYGPLHRSRYLIVADIYRLLKLLNPGLAQDFYDFPLRSLVESAPEDLDQNLRETRAIVRLSLGLPEE